MSNKRDHKSKPAPRTSPVMDSRAPVTMHAEKSLGTHKRRGRKGPYHPLDVKTPSANVLPGSPGSGAAPGANGPATTGAVGPIGGPLGSV